MHSLSDDFPNQNQLATYIKVFKDQAVKLQLPPKHIFSTIKVLILLFNFLFSREREKQSNIQKESIFYLRRPFLTTCFKYE